MDLKKDNIDALFEHLNGQFDIETPLAGHEDRFLTKLKNQNGTKNLSRSNSNWWKPLSVAASLALIAVLGLGIFGNNQTEAEKSPEVAKTQYYFASLIAQEMEKIGEEATPETQKLVDDAMSQIKKLENDYKKLEADLEANGNTKRILSAMITNFQTRINLLEDVLNQIEEVKQLKNNQNENHII